MKKLIVLIVCVVLFIVATQTIKGFPRKQWKQITGTMEVYNNITLVTPLDSLDKTEILTYMACRITEYGDTLRKNYYQVHIDNHMEYNQQMMMYYGR